MDHSGPGGRRPHDHRHAHAEHCRSGGAAAPVSLRVGLTGGIASGKSTVAGMLARFGCFVVDADTLVAGLYLPGHPGHVALVERYGVEILTPDGLVDRPR